MPDEAAFLRTILEHPHDAGPRKVFADWLEERGDPWAELIRLQCWLAGTRFYRDGDEYGRGGPPFFDEPTRDAISRCERLLSDGAGDWTYRVAVAGGVDAKRNPWRACDGDLIWWRACDPIEARLFWWRGLPERADLSAAQWGYYHADYMRSFPLWHLRVNTRAPGRSDVVPQEDILRVVEQYAGRLTTLDVPTWLIVNGFTAWMLAWLDRVGEKCHEATGQPFTLKIGQAALGGAPHSVRERWAARCESILKNSNVRVVARLDARPLGDVLAEASR
jgi:uncharacterized protein (TIGR02996 family)